MTLSEAIATPGAIFWDVEDVPVIELPGYRYWAFAPGSPRRFAADSVWRNGAEVNRDAWMSLLETWGDKAAA